MFNIKANIIVLGETGNGKSSFCNCVLHTPAFRVSDDIYSETKETKGSYGINDSKGIFMIDTPGLQDSQGTDKKHLIQLIDYVKKQTHLQAVLIIFNFHQPRFPFNIKTMIKLLCNAFPQTDFWNHVGLVFTRFFDYLPEKQKKQKIIFAQKYNKEIEMLARENGNYSISNFACPTFFVDSPNEGEEIDYNTQEEINRLISWASTLTPLDVNKTQYVDPNIMKEEVVYEDRKVDEIIDNKNLKKIIKMCKFKRKKQFHYNGEITFTDWEAGQTWEKKEDIPKEVVNYFTDTIPEVKENYNYISVPDIENTGFWRRVFGDYRQKDIRIPSQTVTITKKQRKVYNNGDVEEY